jgi:arsenate reductase
MRLYHNPRCSKSRQALSLMNESGVEFEEYRYLDLGIHTDDLEILSNLENVIRTADLESNESIDLSNQIEVMSLLKSNPRVLQRPILIRGEKAVIGRPPEDIITLLHEA